MLLYSNGEAFDIALILGQAKCNEKHHQTFLPGDKIDEQRVRTYVNRFRSENLSYGRRGFVAGRSVGRDIGHGLSELHSSTPKSWTWASITLVEWFHNLRLW